MASCTTDQEMFMKIIRSSSVAEKKQFSREFSVRVVPSRDTIY